MDKSLKHQIKDFLQGKAFTAGGIIEDVMRDNTGSKGSSTSRILRFMVEDGTIEKSYFPRDKGRSYVVYRIKQAQLRLL